MGDQLTAKDWLDQGLKTLARCGFTALKAERLAKAMGVSRGSFYWHFASLGAFHAAILNYWREVAAEQIIANLEAASTHDNPLSLLLRQAFGGRLALENAVRSWAMFDSAARAALFLGGDHHQKLWSLLRLNKERPAIVPSSGRP